MTVALPIILDATTMLMLLFFAVLMPARAGEKDPDDASMFFRHRPAGSGR